MKKDLFFTAGQFAALHHLNKRTLHYYDDIGLFSPARKGENGYRYYTCRQSADLENILALRESGMSIGEIKDYLRRPNADDFLEIAARKTREIDEQIERLQALKTLLREKRDALALCSVISDGRIEVARLGGEAMLLTPVPIGGTGLEEMEQVMGHLRLAWECSPYKTGCGSYLSVERVKRGEFDVYDGLFTPVGLPRESGLFTVRPEGDYLCGYCVGDWDKIPGLYLRMLGYAEAEGLELTGNCYEIGLNEFAISSAAEYVTQIVVRCERGSPR